MSANAFGSDCAQLARPAVASERRRKAGTCGRRNLPFRDPLNQVRLFLPVLQPSAFDLRPFLSGSLAQFLYTCWRPTNREQDDAKTLGVGGGSAKSIQANGN